MTGAHYAWRRMSDLERTDLLAWRQEHKRPWHSPPHSPTLESLQYLVSAACYEHAPHIGRSGERMDEFSVDLLGALGQGTARVLAWCVLPNHYHALIEAERLRAVLGSIAQLHGRAAHRWNGEDGTRGRRVFFRATDRAMRSEAHAYATINYIHHNPVRHGYVESWTDWPWSSAAEYLEEVGAAEAARRWRGYPLGDYGSGWDDATI